MISRFLSWWTGVRVAAPPCELLRRVDNRASQSDPVRENSAPPTRFERVTFRLGSPSRQPKNSQKPANAAAVDGRGRLDTAGDGWAPVQNRHSAPAWSLAYAYRDVLSRRAVA